jgi:Ser/Thr protein kinase RdoA (MazF antagonist)
MRLPAVAALQPAPLEWRTAQDSMELLAELELDPSSEVKAAIVASPVRYFRVATHDARLFIKIVPPALARRLMRGERLAATLRNHECNVLSIVRDVQTVPDGNFAFVYDYVDAPYLRIDDHNVDLVARALAGLHAGLAADAGWKFAQRSTKVIRRVARRVATDLMQERLPDEEIMSDLREFLKADDAISSMAAQRVHNDLHAANIFMDSSGQPIFFDFEEMSWSHFPAAFDVAKMIERFIFTETTNDATRAESLTKTFLRSYHASEGTIVTGADILIALRWHVGFAWTRLEPLLREGSTGHPEILKFKQLSAIVESRKGWLTELDGTSL